MSEQESEPVTVSQPCRGSQEDSLRLSSSSPPVFPSSPGVQPVPLVAPVNESPTVANEDLGVPPCQESDQPTVEDSEDQSLQPWDSWEDVPLHPPP